MIDENGTYDIPEAEYHADPAPVPSLTNGLIKPLVFRSPLHAWTQSRRLNPDFKPVEKDTFDKGKAVHTAALGKGQPFEIVMADTWQTKAAREQRDLARLAGRVPLLERDYETIEAMVASIRHQLLDGFGIDLVAHRNELCAIAKAEVEGVWCRALIDHAPENPLAPLYDLKTCENASPEACIKAVGSYHYAIQKAHYQDTWFAATGQHRQFHFIFVEKEPPFGITIADLYDAEAEEKSGASAVNWDADWMASARATVRKARRIWARCVETDTWPSYPTQVALLGAPGWYAAKAANETEGQEE